jgi:D-arabinonate dehydratase/D-galactarolactone cycloisomerase
MKITDVEAISLVIPIEGAIQPPISIPFPDKLTNVIFRDYRTTLVRVHTDDGVSGVGECMVRLAPTATRDIIDCVKPVLIGADPFDTDVLWEQVWGVMMNRGHNKGFFVEAMSGIDIALWDLLGKALQKPAYKLLGGQFRNRLWVYASSLRFRGLETTLDEARRLRAAGFDAMKIKIGQQRRQWREDIRLVEAVRNVVGPDVTLMVDVNCGYDRNTAMMVGRELERLAVYWFEEPLPPDDVDGYVALADALDVPVAAGESEFTRYGFKTLITRGAVDIIQPNVSRTGGFSECRKIAALASAYHIPYAPHTGSSSVVCMAASLHLSCALKDFLIYEYMTSDWAKDQKNPLRSDLAELPAGPVQDGHVVVSDRPGLGLVLNEDVLRKYRV